MSSSGTAGGATEAASPAESESKLLEQTKALWHSARGLTHSHLQLAALETRLVGQNMVTMIAAGVAAAILFVTAWLGLVGVMVLIMIDNGARPSVAVFAAVTLNLIGAFILFRFMRSKAPSLEFPATIRSLRPVFGSGQRPRDPFMQQNPRTPQSSSMLKAKITGAELEILSQRADVKLRAASLDRKLRRQLTSPTALFLAAASGFIAEKFGGRRGGRPGRMAGNVKESSVSGHGFLALALKAITLVRTLRAVMPASRSRAASHSPARDDSGIPRKPESNTV
ncbi:MAG: hypothetical protein ABI569_00855 [Casimicrobiaceae bacterium]